jgi:hypothetical protein
MYVSDMKREVSIEEMRELEISWRLYFSAYDRTIDATPPLEFFPWMETYGEEILSEARKYGRL